MNSSLRHVCRHIRNEGSSVGIDRLRVGRQEFDSLQEHGVISSTATRPLWGPPSLLHNEHRGSFHLEVKGSPSSAEVKTGGAAPPMPHKGMLYSTFLPSCRRRGRLSHTPSRIHHLAQGWAIVLARGPLCGRGG
jgi:hypothetical protein